jgi:CrcB protein
MIVFLLVFLGGGIGSAARHAVNLLAASFGADVPWGTFAVNVIGSFVMGLAAGWFAFKTGTGGPQHMRVLVTTGFLGGFTTFSAFSLDAVSLWERGEFGLAAAYVAGSVVISIAALFAGLWVVRSFA